MTRNQKRKKRSLSQALARNSSIGYRNPIRSKLHQSPIGTFIERGTNFLQKQRFLLQVMPTNL